MWFWSIVKLWREALIGGLVISNLFLWIALDKKDDKVRDLSHDLETSQSYVVSLENSIVYQNEMIEEMKAEVTLYDEISADAQREIEKKKIEHKKVIEEIMGAQFGDTCPESIEWLVDIRNRLRW